MYKTLLVIAAIVVNFLPAGNYKNSLNSRIFSALAPGIKTEQESTAPIELPSVPERNLAFPQISSGSAAALFSDFDSGEVFFEKQKDLRLPMASTTKLMTALVVLDNYGPNEVLTVPNYSLHPLDSSTGLIRGSRVKVSELLHALLIESAADASLTFSNALGGENHFAALMNEKAAIFGLTDTQFINSVGYDDPSHYSTAADLTRLARIALSNPLIADIVTKSSYTLTDEAGRKYIISNTNNLLADSRYKGVKTGTTLVAGQCLISLYDDGQRKILGVVLASPERFSDTRNLIDWVKGSFSF